MKRLKHLINQTRRHSGLALITVLSMLALATIVVLAFFSISESEYKASATSTAGQKAKQLADTAVNIVISQIRSGSEQDVAVAGREMHATQPGALRKYSQAGAFIAGYKLYSDQNMIYQGSGSGATGVGSNVLEQNFTSSSEPPTDWNQPTHIARYVDLNEPVVRGVTSATGATTEVKTIFPILDPRAAFDADAANPGNYPVEGFSYTNTTAMTGQALDRADINGKASLVLPSAANPGDPSNLRLPMPVRWIYVLQDGTLGCLEDGGGQASGSFVNLSDSSSVPSALNPIVGRIAFWTDDETCKVNINTASEQTFLGNPIYVHERDRSWADMPAARGEYQRFPGHPATVSLSSIFYPNRAFGGAEADSKNLDNFSRPSALSSILAVKNAIYRLVPRINTGGSEAGTRYFDDDAYSAGGATATAVDTAASAAERLYANTDEMMFSQTATSGTRVVNDTAIGSGLELFDKNTLERTSGFITSFSRGSEINLFGMPKICMWPIADDGVLTPAFRTGFDKLIAFCSTFNGSANSYYFRRAAARNADYDISIARNVELMNYLDNLMSQNFPAGGAGGAGGTYALANKWGSTDNVRQVAICIFDYIRSTNLVDPILVGNRDSWPAMRPWEDKSLGNDSVRTEEPLYRERDRNENSRGVPTGSIWKSYTPGPIRNNDGNSTSGIAKQNDPLEDRPLPGSGQVTPSNWRKGGKIYRGFGRSVSVSEVGLHVICTADGHPDRYSWRMPRLAPNQSPNARDPRKWMFPVFTESDPIQELAELEQATIGKIVSGGRTALALDPLVTNQRKYQAIQIPGYGRTGQPTLENVTAVDWSDAQRGNGLMFKRFYSNFPPFPSPGEYGTITASTEAASSNRYAMQQHLHPGFDYQNWNWTLEPGVPLGIDEKRIQAMLHLELFCPAVGYPAIFPEYTIVLDGQDVSAIMINGRSLFSTTSDVILKSEKPLYSIAGDPQVGGFAPFRFLTLGRNVPPRGRLPQDPKYDADAASGATGGVHNGMLNLDLVSSFTTIKRTDRVEFSSSRPLRFKIYDSHDYKRRDPIQTYEINIGTGSMPPPDLVVVGNCHIYENDSTGSRHERATMQAPHWWTFNAGGALGRINPAAGGSNQIVAVEHELKGRLATDFNGRYHTSSGPVTRQRLPHSTSLFYGKDGGNDYADVQTVPRSVRIATNGMAKEIEYGADNVFSNSEMKLPKHFGTDSVRSFVPISGDPRQIALMSVVPASAWTTHPLFAAENAYMAHNFSNYYANELGFDRSGIAEVADSPNLHLLPQTIDYRNKRVTAATTSVGQDLKFVADLPARADFVNAARRYGDFDDTDPRGRPGPFINKPDEGNYASGLVQPTGWAAAKKYRLTYFEYPVSGTERTATGSLGNFTPNRMISSPVMLGSIPTGAWSGTAGAWRNLLFRPHTFNTTSGSAANAHPGAVTPPDAFLLELFWMPVVEPYAISEPLSTAGKINMNYQMLPFTHIRRATGLHAVLKGEMMSALPNADYRDSKLASGTFGASGVTRAAYFTETGANNAVWHRKIVIDRFANEDSTAPIRGTLAQFEERFKFYLGTSPAVATARGGLFRSPSQICEIHLVPEDSPVGGNITRSALSVPTSRNTEFGAFWRDHTATGDNTRERAYSNIYAKLTTRSNTFTVHVRSQTIRKALRSTHPSVFDPSTDEVTGDYRGSVMIERYIEANNASEPIPNYAAAGDPFSLPPLETFYKFRILESKRFAP